MTKITSVCIYCGSHPGTSPAYTDFARLVGKTLAELGIRLVYGGGTSGLMGAVASASHDIGGQVTGIIPEFLLAHEAIDDPSILCDEVIVTQSMHDRKHKMFNHADAFLAMPGGIGTLEELVEILTWAQLGQHEKPIALLNVEGFWQPLLSMLAHMEKAGFLHNAEKVRPAIITNEAEFRAWLN